MSQSLSVEHNLYSELRCHGFKMNNSGSILISCYVHVQKVEKRTYSIYVQQIYIGQRHKSGILIICRIISEITSS